MSIKTFLKGRAHRTKVDPLVPSYIGVYFCPVDDSLCQAVASQGTALDASTAVAGFGWDGSSLGEVGGVILGAPSFGHGCHGSLGPVKSEKLSVVRGYYRIEVGCGRVGESHIPLVEQFRQVGMVLREVVG